MIGLRFANYTNSNMEARGWKNHDLERESGVPDSTISTYRKGISKKPAKDNMIRIAAAFGDPPSVIDEMIAASNTSAEEEEKRLLADAADQERLERIVAMMRESMVQMLADFREQSAAQQTEILQHADKLVSDAEADFKRRNAEVLKQCKEEIQREKEHAEKRINDAKQYATHIYSVEREHREELRDRNTQSREYLKSIIRNVSACGLLMGAIAFISSIYSLFAFFTFDIADTTQGLYQGNMVAAVLMSLIIVSIMVIIIWRLFLLYKRGIANATLDDTEPNTKPSDSQK